MYNNIRTALQDLLNQAMEQGGMTLMIVNDGASDRPEEVQLMKGYQVALDNNIVENIHTDTVLQELWNQLESNSQKNLETGIWIDALDNLFIEPSTTVYNYDEAMALAIENKQEYIWDWENLTAIKVKDGE